MPYLAFGHREEIHTNSTFLRFFQEFLRFFIRYRTTLNFREFSNFDWYYHRDGERGLRQFFSESSKLFGLGDTRSAIVVQGDARGVSCQVLAVGGARESRHAPQAPVPFWICFAPELVALHSSHCSTRSQTKLSSNVRHQKNQYVWQWGLLFHPLVFEKRYGKWNIRFTLDHTKDMATQLDFKHI